MANWENLIQEVSDVIKPNNSQAITGQVLQNSLINIIESLGEGAVFKGVIDSNNPTPPEFDGPCFCIYKCKTADGKILTAFGGIYVSGYATVLLYSSDNNTWSMVELNKMYNSTVANSGIVGLYARDAEINDAKINSATIDTGSLRVESQFGSDYPVIEINTDKVAIGTAMQESFKRLLIEDNKFMAGTPNVGTIISVRGTGSSLSIGTAGFVATIGTNHEAVNVAADSTIRANSGSSVSISPNVTVQMLGGITVKQDGVIDTNCLHIGPGYAPTTFENDNKVYLGPSAKIGTGIAIYTQMNNIIIKDLVSGKTTQLQLS